MLTGDLYSERLKAFVVDEAHCVKKWYTSPTLANTCLKVVPLIKIVTWHDNVHTILNTVCLINDKHH